MVLNPAESRRLLAKTVVALPEVQNAWKNGMIIIARGITTALGVKLAAPEKTIIAAVGDGSYLFSVPTACHFVSRAHDLPILVIIFNNQCWNAVRGATRALHPQGWAVKANRFPLSDLSPPPAYEMICQANGGYGERVEDPEEVLSALQRALRVVREEGRQAVLNLICKRP